MIWAQINSSTALNTAYTILRRGADWPRMEVHMRFLAGALLFLGLGSLAFDAFESRVAPSGEASAARPEDGSPMPPPRP